MSAPPDFVSLTQIYANVGNETLAFRAWLEALREDDAMKIIEGTKRYRTWWLEEGTSPAFIPTLAKFLRDRRYRTDPGQKSKKVWLGSPEPHPLRWSANWPKEDRIAGPINPGPCEPPKPREGFRPAAEILASRRS